MKELACAVLILLASSCVKTKGTVESDGMVWNYDIENADTLLRHYIDSITFLPLESSEETMLYGIDKFVAKTDYIIWPTSVPGRLLRMIQKVI